MATEAAAGYVCHSRAGGAPPVCEESVRAGALALAAGHLAGGRALRLTVVTGSMAPFLLPGDAVVVEPADLAHLHRGDVLLVMAQLRPFLHRLVAVRMNGPNQVLLTKGDAVPVCDAPVSIRRVLGRVAVVERGSRGLACRGPGAGHMAAFGPLLAVFSLWHARARALRLLWLRRLAVGLLHEGIAACADGAWRCAGARQLSKEPICSKQE